MSEFYDLSQVGTQTDCNFYRFAVKIDPVANEQSSSLISLWIKALDVGINKYD